MSDLDVLKEVQEWDKEIYALREKRDELPALLDSIKAEVADQTNVLRRHEEELKNLQLKQKEMEVELQTKEDNVKKYDAQLSQVKTNKEYSSLQAEIKNLQADNSLLEEKILESLDEVETKKGGVDTERKNLAAKEQALAEKTKEIEAESKSIDARVDELAQKKNEKIKQVKPDIASQYEQIVENRAGLALVQVTGENCPACQIQLRPQIVNEIKLKESVVICESCSRILYE